MKNLRRVSKNGEKTMAKKDKLKMYVLNIEPNAKNEVPTEIKILPLGDVKTQKGDFLMDSVGFKEMLAEYDARKLDKVIDYEHQTLHNVQAPAAGWVKELKLTGDAVVAKVEWNEKALEYLKAGEYKYLSPVVRVRPTDNRAVMLHSIALTNTPAVDGMFAILKDLEDNEEDDDMDLKEFALLLGLPEEATPEEIKVAVENLLGEVKALKEKETPAAADMVCKLLGLKEDANTAELSAAIMALKGNGETVSQADYLALKQRLDQQDGEKLVELALSTGKITPVLKDWAKEYAQNDPEGFKAFTDKAPQVVPMGELIIGNDKLKTGALSESEMMICKQLGVSKEDLEKYGKDEE